MATGMAIIIPSVTMLMSEIEKEQMGKNLGFLTGANSMGQTLGPLVGSLLFVINIHFPYLLAASFLILASFYVQFRYDMVVNEQQLL